MEFCLIPSVIQCSVLWNCLIQILKTQSESSPAPNPYNTQNAQPKTNKNQRTYPKPTNQPQIPQNSYFLTASGAIMLPDYLVLLQRQVTLSSCSNIAQWEKGNKKLSGKI